jgi:hypothetical protein
MRVDDIHAAADLVLTPEQTAALDEAFPVGRKPPALPTI